MLSAIVTMTAHPAVHAQGNDGPPSAPPALAETAQKFLKSLPREWSGTSRRDCKTYEDKNIARLAPPFAASAARFLHAFVEVHGHVTITSAHRTAQEQTCVCEGERGPCAGRPRLSQPRSAGASSSAAPPGIRTALPSMCAPASALTRNLPACMSSHSSTHSSACDFRWASATGRTWSRLNRTTHRCGSQPSVRLRASHAMRQAQNYAGRCAGRLAPRGGPRANSGGRR